VNTAGTVSYAVCGGAFLLLAILAFFGRNRAQGKRYYRVLLISACVTSALWAGILSLGLSYSLPSPLLAVAEALRDAAWLFFLSSLLPSRQAGITWMPWLKYLSRALPSLWLAYTVWWWVSVGWYGVSGFHLDISMVIGGLLSALAGLALIEQIYRNLRPDRRWAMKYLSVGLGAVFAYDLYLYSYALLLHRIDLSIWDARGVVNLMAVPLIAISAARNPQWSTEVFISRRLVFHTTTLMGAGLYLLAMAAGGYYVREVGGTWGRFAQILFFAGALLVLAVILFSGQVRARVRVLLTKYFFTYKYDYREEWLRLTRRLYMDKSNHDPYVRALLAVADIMESPGGALWLRRHGNVFLPVARHNFSVGDDAVLTFRAPLAEFMRRKQWIIDIEEYVRDPSFYPDLEMPVWLTSLEKAWLIVPLLSADELAGFITLAQPRAKVVVTWEDRDLLKTAGQTVGGFLAHNEDANALSEARQFEAYNRVTTFLMHDLKNIMAQLSLMLGNAARHKHNPAFVDDMIATVEHSVQRMERLLEQLRRKGAQKETVRVDVAKAVRTAVERLGPRKPVPAVELADEAARARVEPDTLMMVVSHILRNAQDATAPDGSVAVRVATRGNHIEIVVEDDGCGMDTAFMRDRLFQPFFTTKSSKGMGIGAYQAREFARAAGGGVEVESEPGQGTRFRLWLPLADGQADLRVEGEMS